MTHNTQNLSREASQHLKQVRERLRDKGVDVENLVVVQVGNEWLLGELLNRKKENQISGVSLRDPKRFLRLQKMGPMGLEIQFLIGDLDMMASGQIDVKPNTYYEVTWMDFEGQTHLLGLYLDYLDRKTQNRAKEAGLILPKMELAK